MTKSLVELEAERESLLLEFTKFGDMRRGSISEVYRRCGKDNCACAKSGHPGHGPFYAYTTKVEGKTKTLQLRPGPRLEKIQGEVDEYKKFRNISDRVVNVNEQICDTRAIEEPDAQEKKRRSSRVFKPQSARRSKR